MKLNKFIMDNSNNSINGSGSGILDSNQDSTVIPINQDFSIPQDVQSNNPVNLNPSQDVSSSNLGDSSLYQNTQPQVDTQNTSMNDIPVSQDVLSNNSVNLNPSQDLSNSNIGDSSLYQNTQPQVDTQNTSMNDIPVSQDVLSNNPVNSQSSDSNSMNIGNNASDSIQSDQWNKSSLDSTVSQNNNINESLAGEHNGNIPTQNIHVDDPYDLILKNQSHSESYQNMSQQQNIPDNKLPPIIPNVENVSSNTINQEVPYPNMETQNTVNSNIENDAVKSEDIMSNREEDILGVMSYVIIINIFILIFSFIKKDNFIKFHSIQGFIFDLLFIILFFILKIFNGSGILSIVLFVLEIILFILWILLSVFLMYKAYSGDKYKFIFLGSISNILS